MTRPGQGGDWPPGWEAVEAEFRKLPAGLQQHCHRVGRKARALALRFGADPGKAHLAALAHDVARTMADQELLDTARRRGLDVGPAEERFPLLLHTGVGVERLRELGVTDEAVLEVVRDHTTGRAGMSLLARVVFLADKLDPNKVRGIPALERAARLARRDLDRAILAFFDWHFDELEKQGATPHPDSVAFRDHLRRNLGHVR